MSDSFLVDALANIRATSQALYSSVIPVRGRPAGAATLAERARTAVSTFDGCVLPKSHPRHDFQHAHLIVTIRGLAIEACLEAALAPGGDRAKWEAEARRVRDTVESPQEMSDPMGAKR